MDETKIYFDELLKDVPENFELEIEEIVLDSDVVEKGVTNSGCCLPRTTGL